MNSGSMRWTAKLSGLVGAVLVTIMPGMAQDASGPRVEVEVSVHQEITRASADGQTLVEQKAAGPVVPGDILAYTLRARNLGASPAFETVIEDPIPDGTVLLTDSVGSSGSRISASIDGGESWKTFPVFIPSGEDDQGQTLYAQASPASYTHLRWLLEEPLKPGETREVSFKVQVR